MSHLYKQAIRTFSYSVDILCPGQVLGRLGTCHSIATDTSSDRRRTFGPRLKWEVFLVHGVSGIPPKCRLSFVR